MSYNINKKSKTKEKFRSFLSTFTCQVLTLSQYMLSAVVWMGSVPHRLMHLNTVPAGTEGWEDCGMFRIWRFAVGNVSLRLYSPAPFLNHSLLSECRRDMTSQLPAPDITPSLLAAISSSPWWTVWHPWNHEPKHPFVRVFYHSNGKDIQNQEQSHNWMPVLRSIATLTMGAGKLQL